MTSASEFDSRLVSDWKIRRKCDPVAILEIAKRHVRMLILGMFFLVISMFLVGYFIYSVYHRPDIAHPVDVRILYPVGAISLILLALLYSYKARSCDFAQEKLEEFIKLDKDFRRYCQSFVNLDSIHSMNLDEVSNFITRALYHHAAIVKLNENEARIRTWDGGIEIRLEMYRKTFNDLYDLAQRLGMAKSKHPYFHPAPVVDEFVI